MSRDDIWVLVKENGTLVRRNGDVLMFRSELASHRWFGLREVSSKPLILTTTNEEVESLTLRDYEELVDDSIKSHPSYGILEEQV